MSIDFNDYITEKVRDFTGREWVFQRFTDWLKQEESRIFLLTGGPGTGKSAIAARLVQISNREIADNKYPNLGKNCLTFHHFCQAQNDPTLNPLRFVEALSLELANKFDVFRSALLKIDQDHKDIHVTANISANEIQDGADVKGVFIKTLSIGDISARRAFDMIVRRPLEALYQSGFNETILILVDSMDEALTYGDDNIATTIKNSTDHADDLPAKVRWLLTSRDDPRVLHLFGQPTLDLIKHAPDDVNDVRDYAYRRLKKLSEDRRQILAERIADVGTGNFLYARYILDDLPPNIEHIEDIRAIPLPKDLNEIYRNFLEREIGTDLVKWRKSYSPLFGVLAVSRGQGLTGDQLAGIVKLRRSEIDSLLDFCDQYLTGSKPGGPFQIYHHSFREFLLENKDLSIYPQEAHEDIANYYLSKYQHNWKLCDDYGLAYLPIHLAESNRLTELRKALLDFNWLQTKLNTLTVNALISDYDYLPDDRELKLIQSALRLSSNQLTQDQNQLTTQLLGRLMSQKSTAIHNLLEQAVKAKEGIWLRPLFSSLIQPGGPLLRSLHGHNFGVNYVAITPDGKAIVSAAADTTLKVWDIQSGEVIYTLEGHSKPVNAVAITHDGKAVVSASWDKTLKVWNLQSGKLIHTLKGHDSAVMGVAITPDGKAVVSASDDGTLKVWDLQSREVIHTLEAHSSRVADVAITPNGKSAVSASWDSTLKVWDIQSGEVIQTLEGHNDWVQAVAITPDGKSVVSGSSDKTLKVWDLQSGEVIQTLEGHSDQVCAVAVILDGKSAVSASKDTTLKVWNLQSGEVIYTLEGHSGKVTAVTVTSDGEAVVSASKDNTLKVWDLQSDKVIEILERHSLCITYVAITTDGKSVVSVSSDKTLKVWDLQSGKVIQTLEGHNDWIRAVAITPDGKLAVSASGDKTLKVWDLQSGEVIHTLEEGHNDYVWAVAITPDSKSLILASSDTTLKVWDLQSGEVIQRLKGHRDQVFAVAITPNGKSVVSASRDTTLKVWDLQSEKVIHSLEGHNDCVKAVAITPDGKSAVSASDDKTLKVWDLQSGRVIYTLQGHGIIVDTIAITQDSKVAVLAMYKTLKIWNLQSGEVMHTLERHRGKVTAVAITPDGKAVVSASGDRTLKVWDMQSGKQITNFKGDSVLTSCSVSPDNKTIVVGEQSGRVHFLRLEGLV